VESRGIQEFHVYSVEFREKFHGTFRGIPWNFVELHETEVDGIPWNSMEFREFTEFASLNLKSTKF
jgi:hypothetical protein